MKGRDKKELEQLKSFSLSLKIQEATSKSVAITEKKGKQYVRQISYINHGHLFTKVTPVIDFTDEPVIQCDVPIVENTFVFREHQQKTFVLLSRFWPLRGWGGFE